MLIHRIFFRSTWSTFPFMLFSPNRAPPPVTSQFSFFPLNFFLNVYASVFFFLVVAAAFFIPHFFFFPKLDTAPLYRFPSLRMVILSSKEIFSRRLPSFCFSRFPPPPPR